MFIVIVGCSPTGYHLARLSLVSGHEVVVVEQSESRCQLLREELGSVALHGDGADPEDLQRAGITRADTVVALTGRDETNLVVCQLAKQRFSVDRTAAVIKDAKNQPISRLLGVDLIINSADLILDRLEQGIADVNLRRRLTLRIPNTSIVSVALSEDAPVVGKRLEDVAMPARSFVSLVIRKDRVLKPAGLTLAGGDELFAVTVAEEEQELYDIFMGVQP